MWLSIHSTLRGYGRLRVRVTCCLLWWLAVACWTDRPPSPSTVPVACQLFLNPDGRAYTPPLRPPGGCGWDDGGRPAHCFPPLDCHRRATTKTTRDLPFAAYVRRPCRITQCVSCVEKATGILLAVDDDRDFYGRHSLGTFYGRVWFNIFPREFRCRENLAIKII